MIEHGLPGYMTQLHGSGWWRRSRFADSPSLRKTGRNSPFTGDNAFGNAIADYRQDIVKNYTALAEEQGLSRDSRAWFADHRKEIELPGLNSFAKAACLRFLAEYEPTPSCVEALGRAQPLARPHRCADRRIPAQWEASCAELEASLVLPKRIREMLGTA
jgi:hypothetical protein